MISKMLKVLLAIIFAPVFLLFLLIFIDGFMSDNKGKHPYLPYL